MKKINKEIFKVALKYLVAWLVFAILSTAILAMWYETDVNYIALSWEHYGKLGWLVEFEWWSKYFVKAMPIGAIISVITTFLFVWALPRSFFR